MNEKPDWQTYFLTLAYVVAQRSPDTTKHGCVIVDPKHRIVATGYNGPISGMDDEKIPHTRPEKYDYMEHAERNAIFNSHQDLYGCEVYLTGHPCIECYRAMCQVGIQNIYIGGVESHCVNDIMKEKIRQIQKIALKPLPKIIKRCFDSRDLTRVLQNCIHSIQTI